MEKSKFEFDGNHKRARAAQIVIQGLIDAQQTFTADIPPEPDMDSYSELDLASIVGLRIETIEP